MAADLVNRRVEVIVATGGNVSALAAKAATTTIPIVFTSGIDPEKTDLVTNPSRPEGNLTGISWFSSQLTSKGLGLLHETRPERGSHRTAGQSEQSRNGIPAGRGARCGSRARKDAAGGSD
jgi:ABC transporter substrate binding protein